MANISTDIQLDLSLSGNQAEDIQRNLSFLYATRKGSVPLDRDFGLDWSMLDYPTEVAKNLLAAEIMTQTAKYESRARVSSLKWLQGNEGQLKLKVVISDG